MHLRITIVLLLAMLAFPSLMMAGDGATASRQVHPNPFTEGTTFDLNLPKSTRIRISVYDLLGRLVRTLEDGLHAEGKYPIPWDGKDYEGNSVQTGIYICVLFSEEAAVESVKVIKVSL